jgi:thiamine-phosphate pyrophosphorylase
MTDERQGDALWAALARLPRGSGVVFRHYALPGRERRALFDQVRRFCRRRGLLLIAAGAAPGRADGHHRSDQRRTAAFRTAPAHSIPEIRTAERAGAVLVFLSPVFPTRSHPGARTLGRVRFGLAARAARVPIIALGGLDSRRARHVPGAYGWAAIDAWSATAQKRKAVPR